MRVHMADVKGFFRIAFRSTGKLSIKAVTKKNLPYFCDWIAVFIWLYSFFLPMGGFRFENRIFGATVGDSPFYYYAWLISGCMIPMFLDGKKFVRAKFYSVIVSLVCFAGVPFIGPGPLSRALMMVCAFCIGHIFASSVYTFFMVLNNSEKFYSMILAVLLPKMLMYLKPVLNWTQFDLNPPIVIIFLIMITLAVTSYFFKSNTDTIPSSEKVKVPINAYSLLPVVFVALALNDVIAPAALSQITDIAKRQIESYYFVGILIGLAAVLLLQNRFSLNICNMINISFAFLAVGFVIDIVRMQYPDAGLASALCFGISYSIGVVNIYYLAGFMVKKFRSVSFYRTGILLSALYYFISSFLLHLFKESELLATPILMAFISVCIIILFFILSPFFVKILYSGEWIDDAYREDVSQCSRLEAKLKDHKLTPAEIEVCRLLLDGYTLRQISGIQSKAYATINTYCTSIYRKLNINSRAELLLLLHEYKK